MNNLSSLIESITPFYNSYKQNKNTLHPKESIKIMWDLGNILNTYIVKKNLKPHNLYREIYGKSESNTNIQQKSYIPREFQGKCVRIYKIFENKNKIDEILPNLNSATNFKEAMPFFDNPKYKLNDKEYTDLLKLLNSNYKANQVIKEIRRRLKLKNNVSNPRTQRLHELDDIKKDFIEVYKYIDNLIKENEYSDLTNLLEIENNILINYSKVLSALTSEDILCPDMVFDGHEPEPFNLLSKLLIRLFSKPKSTERSRFRKLIPIKVIFLYSEMIFSLTDQDTFNNLKNRFN
tara:strand:+ start:808 stop:1683 length:876 start_codon:yes stop_codon:yes gene_type:complete